MRTTPALFASLLTLLCTQIAIAQPYGWFASGRLTVVNLATGTTLAQQAVPAGIQLGEGDIDPITGDYLAITNVGTFRLRASPPSIASQVARLTVAASVMRLDQEVPRGVYVLRIVARSACGDSATSVERIVRVQ